MKSFAVLAALSLVAAGCGGADTDKDGKAKTAKSGKAKDKKGKGKKAKNNDPPPFNPNATADNIALVPSPIETQRALEAAGIDQSLKDLIVDRNFDLANSDTEYAALRSGVVLAQMLLTVKTADDAELVAKIGQVRTGMTQLGGGKDIDKTLRDMQERIKAKAVTRDELLKEFEELSGAVIPELEFNGNDRVIPLIEAGSWLEGANLVAKAIKASGKPKKADALLKQPAVVDYFIDYVEQKGAKTAGKKVAKKLKESLKTLKGLASQKKSLSAEDIDTVIKVTDEVLALL